MLVTRVQMEGSPATIHTDKAQAMEEVGELLQVMLDDEGHQVPITISVIEMSQEQIDNLPEFEGY